MGCHVPHLQSMFVGSTRQQLPIWTPHHTMKGRCGIVRVPKGLDTGSRGCVPHADGIPPATGNRATIWTPPYTKHKLAMAVQHPERGPAIHIPDTDQLISTPADQSRAVWTPVNIVEGDGVATHDVDALSTHYVPYTQSAIFTATEQPAVIRCESKAVHAGGMPMQNSPIA